MKLPPGRLMALVVLALPLVSPADQFGNFSYTSDGTNITITFYNGPGGAVVIPNTISNLPVTAISGSAFPFPFAVTSVTLPDNLTTIGSGAFRNSGLTHVTLGSNVTSIGDGAFAYCLGLTNIAVDVANTEYVSIDDVLFNNAQTILLQCPSKKSGNYVIPGSVTIIGETAFADCTNLAHVTIPGSVTIIGEFAFHESGLTSVTIPNNVASIGMGAFSSCPGLTSVTIGSGVSTIGQGAFIFCNSLTNIAVDIANTSYASSDGVLIDTDHSTLVQCPGGKAGNYEMPDNIMNIGAQAFAVCNNLTNVLIGHSVNTIQNSAFSFCYSLTSVGIPDSVIDMGGYAFSGCPNLVRVTIPASITTLQSSSFEHCSSLTNLYFAGNFPSPLNHVLEGTTNVTVYYLPGTTGWGPTYAGRPAVLWNPEFTTATLAGGAISCAVTGTPYIPVAFEASTSLTAPLWTRLLTTNLTAGSLTFQDPDASANSARFYRIAGPP